MTWTRKDSKSRVHAKCAKAGNEAASFWHWAIEYSNDNGTDGFLDDGILHIVMPVPINPKKAKALAEACVGAFLKPGGAGLFEKAEGGYRIHDFHDYQPPADEKAKKEWLSSVRANAGRKGGQRSSEAKRQAKDQANGKQELEQTGKQNEAKDSTSAGARVGPGSGSEVFLPEEQEFTGVRARDPDETSPEASAAGSEPAEPAPESGYDIVWRHYRQAWERRYRRQCYLNTDTGEYGDERCLMRLWAEADRRGGPDAERWIAHWVTNYLAESGSWVESEAHPLRGIEKRLNKMGAPKAPKPAPTRREPAPPPEAPMPSDTYIARARALAAGTASKLAADPTEAKGASGKPAA